MRCKSRGLKLYSLRNCRQLFVNFFKSSHTTTDLGWSNQPKILTLCCADTCIEHCTYFIYMFLEHIRKLVSNLIADALDFAASANERDVRPIQSMPRKQITATQFNMQSMEMLLVLTIEFGTGAGIALVSSWLLTASETTAVLYWFYEYVFAAIALLFVGLWLTMTYASSQTNNMLLACETASVIGHNCILCSVIVLFVGFAAIAYEADETRWIHAALLEPAFQFQSLELIHALQLIATSAFVTIMLIGFVFVRSQFISILTPVLQQITPQDNFNYYLSQTLKNFSFSPYLRFWCVFNILLQEYLLNVLHRVCDDLIDCKFNTAVIPVPGNSDVIIMFVIYALCCLVLECLSYYYKNGMSRPQKQHDTTPFVLGTLVLIHLSLLAFLTYLYLPSYFVQTSTFNTVLFFLSVAWTLFDVVPLYFVERCSFIKQEPSKKRN